MGAMSQESIPVNRQALPATWFPN